MNGSIRIFIAITVALLIGTSLYFGYPCLKGSTKVTPQTSSTETIRATENQPADDIPVQTPTPDTSEITAETATKETSIKDVPFIVQAPNGEWDNPIFQDGCEEASMLMAMGWVRGTTYLSANQESDAITKLAAFEVAILEHHEDVSLPEIVAVLQDYFHYDQATLSNDVTLSDMTRELSDGNVLLAPTFGQALHNPNYTAPGPVTHMLVLTGYDPTLHEFIANDPGTKRGKNYRYDENVLFNAIWAYPAGATHPPAPASAERTKSVIVIRPGT